MRLFPLAILAGALALPATALGRTPQPLVNTAPRSTSFKDRLLTSDAPRARAAQAGKAYLTPDGIPVQVRFTSAYTPDDNVAQTYVNFLGGLPHGTELGKLSMLLATPSEVEDTCGGGDGVLACYDGRSHQMIVPGEQIQSDSGVTTSYVVTHEYGHHIAAFRDNRPFDAMSIGPKHWASYEKVCDRVLGGKLVPGAEGRYYLANPGESWAETYARLTYPNEPWRFSTILKPDAGALEAARRDVLTPWTKATVKTFTGRFTAKGPNLKSYAFALTLDGALKVKLHGPSRARYDLAISSLGENRGRTKGNAARDQLTFKAACRQRRNEQVGITVLRRTGAGPFTVDVTYAG